MLLTLSTLVMAQQSTNITQVDQNTYNLYLQKSWKKLLEEGNTALSAGIDYYYLRVRMGIASFETGNYHEAVKHFQKAQKFNDSEGFIREYLYFAYLWSGKNAEAKLIAKDFTDENKKNTGTESTLFIEKLDLAFNANVHADAGFIDNYTIDIPASTNGGQFIPKSHKYYFVGLQHSLGNRLSFYHGYSNLQVDLFSYAQSLGNITANGNFSSKLHQYYGNLSLSVSKGLSMSGGIHWLQTRFQVSNTLNINNDLVAFISAYKSFPYISIGATFYRANLMDVIQNQTDLKILLYPLGNLNLYSISTGSFQNQQFTLDTSENRYVLDQKIGIKASPWLWLEAYGTFGEIDNFILNDGLVVYNRMDVIKQRFGGRVILLPLPKWNLTLDLGTSKNESIFISETGASSNLKTYNINAFTLISSWKF
jgi:hypothetical protein